MVGKRFQISGKLVIMVDELSRKPMIVLCQMMNATKTRDDFWLNIEAWHTLTAQIARLKAREEVDVALNEAMKQRLVTWASPKDKYLVSCIQERGSGPSRCVTMQENELVTFLIYAPLITMELVRLSVNFDWFEAGKMLRREPANECSECGDIILAARLTHGRKLQRCDSKLFKHRCFYCYEKLDIGCHCHLYDCKICEPSSFCIKCGGLKLYPHVNSIVA